MEHNLFKPKSFDEGKHAVVGDCNGIPMEERWKVETPLFADAILKQHFSRQVGPAKTHPIVLDYGCGVGRLSKEILTKSQYALVTGVDASTEMMSEAKIYVANERFNTCSPEDLTDKYDLAYCVYVLQHVPSIEIREILSRIHYHLKDDGIFVYCSSDYRMAIRFDNGGFFDDRFMGINLQEEIERLFDWEDELFTDEILDANPILKTMIKGGLPHPAKVYRKKKITDYLHVKKEKSVFPNGAVITSSGEVRPADDKKKLVLVNRLAPGDVLVMTNAIRDLHKAHPGKYITDVRTSCQEIFQNNPYITKLSYDDSAVQAVIDKFSQKSDPMGNSDMVGDIKVVDMQYPLIHRSGEVGAHFSEGHREYLETLLKVKIPQTALTPEIYLDSSESQWVSPVAVKLDFHGKYWVINAGSKGDYTLKQYPYYQEVVNLLKDKITFVQIGQLEHAHVPLEGALDLRGKTNIRELFRVIYHAQGVLTCVSFPMHIAATFKKPCVVVAGAREGTRWELYANHQFMYVNGCLPCATYDGCWKSKQSDCTNKVGDIAKCMTLMPPEDVVRAVTRYYDGGTLQY